MQGRREERDAFPFLLPREALHASHAPIIYPLSLPFGTPVTQAKLFLKQLKKRNVFTRNIEILLKPSHYLNSIFIIFLSCQCRLLQCVIKAFNKRQCLAVCTNLVHYFS